MKDTEQCSEMGNIYISSEQIIQEVQKFRCLYDPADPDHKDRDVMRDAWLSVTQAVVGEPWANLNSAEKNEAARELQRRWKNIRDSLRKSLNSSGKNRKPYAFHNELTFLLETESFRNISDTDDTAVAQGAEERTETSSSRPLRILRPKRNSSVIDYLDETSATHEADELSETPDSRPATRSPRSKRKKQKPRQIIQTTQKDNSSERDQTSASVSYNTCTNSFSGVNFPRSQSTRVPEPENPDRMFLLSLLPRVSALSSRNKLDFQIKAMKMLRGFEKDDSNS